jgi:hypothetical protein
VDVVQVTWGSGTGRWAPRWVRHRTRMDRGPARLGRLGALHPRAAQLDEGGGLDLPEPAGRAARPSGDWRRRSSGPSPRCTDACCTYSRYFSAIPIVSLVLDGRAGSGRVMCLDRLSTGMTMRQRKWVWDDAEVRQKTDGGRRGGEKPSSSSRVGLVFALQGPSFPRLFAPHPSPRSFLFDTASSSSSSSSSLAAHALPLLSAH